MSDEREKLLRVMKNLESDYKSGKISAEKYSYFRSKYEDKLNSIDAKAATKRIRSMQGKPASNDGKRRRRRRPTKNKRKEEQDLVQKYIINPKKDDSKYNKKEKSSMDSGTFKLFLVLILVIGFTAGTAYGIFNLDFGSVPDSDAVAIVSDTAFPDINEDVTDNTTSSNSNASSHNTNNNNDVETTTDDSNSDNHQGSGGSGSGSGGSGSGSGGSNGGSGSGSGGSGHGGNG